MTTCAEYEQKDTNVTIKGYCTEQFERVYRAFSSSFEGSPDDMNTELGASVSVTLNGETVVDLWGGYTDEGRSQEWNEDTIVCVQSVGKGILATCAMILADRGLLDVDRPMSQYWPEFAAKEKQNLPVRWALSHQLGMPAWEAPELGMGYDWEWATSALADSAPDLTPGQSKTYHPYTFGFLVGEIIRRVSGQSVSTFLEEEITSKLNINFSYGVKPQDNGRVATFTKLRHGDNVAGGEAGAPSGYSDIMRRALDVLDHDEDYNSPKWRGSSIPAANGHTNARALARLYAVLAHEGELAGVRLANPQTLNAFTEIQWGGDDLIIPANTNVALGYMLNSPSYYAGPNPKSFGHAGMGGAYGFADRENKLSFGYTPNKIWLGTKVETGRRCDRLVDAVYEALAR